MRAPGAVSFAAARRPAAAARAGCWRRRDRTARAGARCVRDAVRLHHLDHRRDAVEPGIGARDAHGARSMSVASTRRRSARAAAMARTPLPVPRSRIRPPRRLARCGLAGSATCRAVEREQAAARGAVMAGAEGERRLDLDADPVRRHAARSCAPCTTKRPAATGVSPARLSRTQSLRRDAREAQRLRRLAPAAAATSARTASSSGACGNKSRPASARRRCRTGPPRRRPPAMLSATRASAMRRAVCSSVSRRATAVAAGAEFIGSPDVFRPLPVIHSGTRDGPAEILDD